MDDCCGTDSSVGAGAVDWLYDGLFYSYPAGHCHYRRAGQPHSGAEARLKGRILLLHSAAVINES